ncbi:MAG: hypothetical protein AAB466_10395 [Verrucomicrobiota bacterium]
MLQASVVESADRFLPDHDGRGELLEFKQQFQKRLGMHEHINLGESYLMFRKQLFRFVAHQSERQRIDGNGCRVGHGKVLRWLRKIKAASNPQAKFGRGFS